MNIIPWVFFPSLLVLLYGVYMQGIRDGYQKGWKECEDIATCDITEW